MELSFKHKNATVDPIIDELIKVTEGIHHPELVREMIISALKSGQENSYLADIKFLNNAMKEMRYTNKVFAPYHDRQKVTIFGSARTDPGEKSYQDCVEFSRRLAEKGYMIITGGGGGIMQAGNEGAGSENSFAVNIHLPFEQAPNEVMANNPRLITYRYFFNRKVAFVKEAAAIAVFPGGFGTLDEAMEVFTLIQTGKTTPKPLILLDDESGYWEGWFEFIKMQLLGRGFVSAGDFSIFTITRSVEEAVQVIEDFYKNYNSHRFADGRLIIRLNKELSDEQIGLLAEEFPEMLKPGTSIDRTAPLPEEDDEPDMLHLPRIILHFDKYHYGLLIAFIRRLNQF
ncbi:MAG: TIGR00730 family Rossman fold protein [Desulfuromonadales bacterium]|nr:TIGR00730 family Rossman fold protein [Desulfuromonadales bacterium]